MFESKMIHSKTFDHNTVSIDRARLDRARLDRAKPSRSLRLLCVTAHPDDESMAMGGTLARYAAEGVETHVLCATRGERGRYRDNSDHPGPEALGRIREAELRAAARELGVRSVQFLDYVDGELDQADPAKAGEQIAAHIRRLRPHVVLTFGPDGLYGHPDHIAISQLTTAAVLRAACAGPNAHRVAKLYYLAWSESTLDAFESAYKPVTARVDGVMRRSTPWRDWIITTNLDTRPWWPAVWRAVRCHVSQVDSFNRLEQCSPDEHEAVWGSQQWYRALSLVNGGRETETDLFAGLRGAARMQAVDASVAA